MTKKQNKQDEPKAKRGTRFVPAEDVPLPGLSQRSREVVALALIGFAMYAMLALATFRIADLDAVTIPSGDMENLGGAVGYYLTFGFARALGFAGWAAGVVGDHDQAVRVHRGNDWNTPGPSFDKRIGKSLKV